MPPNRSLDKTMMVDYSSSMRTPSMTRNLSRETLAKLAEREVALREGIPVTTVNQLRPLYCAAQQYAWGRRGSNSTVARMKKAQTDDFCIDEEQPYAELWLGTHPSGMSHVAVEKQDDDDDEECCSKSLLDYVQESPELHCGREEWRDLTFLLKVLSIEKVLSIQAHPDKKLAERLHASRPHVYKDPNHKPEMAICISETMKALCGFRPIREIARSLEEYPELRALVGEEAASRVERMVQSPATRAVLQRMFQSYLECSQETVQEQLDLLLDRLGQLEAPDEVQRLMLNLSKQFPNDAGIMAPLLFNVVTLNRGEALFIGANEPHAYICGELVECMACSDNVVRAGLTPKLKDVPTLVDMLTYKSQMPEVTLGRQVDECTRRYEPPVPDFCVEVVHVAPFQTYELGQLASPSVLLCMSGDAVLQQEDVCKMEVSFGKAAFCSAKTGVRVVAGAEGVRLTRAFTNIYHDEYQYEGLEF